ncbi:MAG: hypothetical protein ABI977_21660, partial [Acidobacteriota bacterium]
MTADEFVELFNDPRFIKGIHNYCDNWCERCAFTARCFNFAQRQAMEEELGFDPTDEEAGSKQMLHTLQNSFSIAKELIERGAAKHGIDINSPEFQAGMEEVGEEQDRLFEAARAHPLSQAADEYAFSVHNWFKRRDAELQTRIEQAQKNDEVHPDQLQPEDVESAIEVIYWYQFQPAATLTGIFCVEEIEEIKGSMADDNNGQMKTILIGLDRSLLAWG